MKYTLPLLLLLAYSSSYASETEDATLQKQWNALRAAVGQNQGISWEKKFNTQHPYHSKEGVEVLAACLDFSIKEMAKDSWTEPSEDNPSELIVTVNKKRIVGLTASKYTDIIRTVRQQMREEKAD